MEKKTDLRIKKTYLALHNAFTELLSKKYFEDITINELCDAAMIRRTTFYKHFSDKYDYFNFYLSELIKQTQKSVPLDTMKENPIEYSEKRLYECLEFLRHHQKLMVNLKNSNMASYFYHSALEQFKKELLYILTQIEQPSLSPQLDFASTLYAGALISAITWWIDNPNTLTDKEIAKLLVETLSHPQTQIN